ncbi:hypothetical protein GZH47_02145 [Paenibacillus rhizovicinus]|uniref:Uncharacterized protein n=1 Tax=Paenibacillus rhizovicinus TaxID=2704463 RepID=A0A6C0NV03_9BACL|nr:hypothetical protein [Paenibacillus rhizovicinus]QHW29756.1 hypothetical protein GZH47_02145 [Paenibacillus rhizovicinus]
MRTIYGDYRGFKVFQQTNKYYAIHNDTDVGEHAFVICQGQLIEVLNTIDAYMDK